MKSLLGILIVTFADIIGTIAGFAVLFQGLAIVTGSLGMSAVAWQNGIPGVIIGFIFIIPNALFRFLFKRLSFRTQYVGYLVRAVIVTVITLLLAVGLSTDPWFPFWLWFLVIARPISAFALALEGDKQYRERDSEPSPAPYGSPAAGSPSGEA